QDEARQVLALVAIEPGRWLVEHQDGRLECERARKPDQLLDAEGQAVHGRVAIALELDETMMRSPASRGRASSRPTSEIFAAMARDIGTGAQDVFDEGRRDGLAAGRDDEIARAVDKAQRARVPFAGAQPAVLAPDRAGCVRIVPIGLEQIGALHSTS